MILSVIPHEVERARSWQDIIQGELPVLADGGFRASCLYGVAFQMRVHTDTSNTPGAFLIDLDGIIRYARLGEGESNWSDRPEITELLTRIDGG